MLIDFGIAHLQDDVRHTVGGLVMGTPGYLSPELVEGAAITDATDWWGWAATITYAASGRPPFGRGRMDAVLTRVRAGDVDLDGVDPRLVPLLRASLSPDPRLRPHADEVIAALELYAAGRAATVPTPSGGLWDDGRSGAVPGDTQVVQGGSTAVMPPLPPPVTPPVALPTAHRGADTAARWAPPPTGPRAPTPDLTAYDHEDVEDGPAGGYWPEEEWDEEEPAPREGDPRIGLPMRTGLLAAVSAAWIGALMAWPGIAVVALVALSALARATDRSVTALVLRRYDFGRRRSDVPFAVVSSPWHLVVGTIATVVGLLLPVAVALAGVFATALLLAGTQGTELGPGAPITLAVGGVLGLLMLWWGPGGASLRRGSRSMARRLVPVGLASQIVGGLLRRPGPRRCAGGAATRREPHVETLLRQSIRPLTTGALRRLTRFGGACGPGQRPLCRPCAPVAHQRLPAAPKKDHGSVSAWVVRRDNVTYRQCSAEPGLWPERELHHLVPGSLRRVRLHTYAPTTSHGHPSIRSLSAPSLASQGCSPHPWAGRGRGTQCGQ